MKRSMIRLTITLLGIGLVFAGCGGDSGGSRVTTVGEPDPDGNADSTEETVEINPVALARTAKAKSEAATSFRGEIVTSFTGVPELEFSLLASLEVAANGDSATITELTETSQDVLGSSDSADTRSEIRFVGDVVYALLPEYFAADTPWVSFGIDELTDVDLDSLESSDTSAFLNYLVGINNEATVTQGEEVNGVLTTRISGKYTMADILNAVPEDQQKAMADSLQFFSGMGESFVTELIDAYEGLPVQLDVWIDLENYIVRQRIVVDEWYEFLLHLDPSAEGSKEEIDSLVQVIDLQLFDYGASITIEPPPQEDVTRIDGFDEFSGLATSGSSG